MFRGYPPMAGFLPPMQPMPRGRRGQDFVGVPPQMMGFVQPMMNYPRPQQRKPRAFRQQAPGSPKSVNLFLFAYTIGIPLRLPCLLPTYLSLLKTKILRRFSLSST